MLIFSVSFQFLRMTSIKRFHHYGLQKVYYTFPSGTLDHYEQQPWKPTNNNQGSDLGNFSGTRMAGFLVYGWNFEKCVAGFFGPWLGFEKVWLGSFKGYGWVLMGAWLGFLARQKHVVRSFLICCQYRRASHLREKDTVEVQSWRHCSLVTAGVTTKWTLVQCEHTCSVSFSCVFGH